MGIYDREYYQEEKPGFSLGADRMMVTNLVIVNVVIYFVDVLLFHDTNALTNFMELKPGVFWTNWKLWELITYGFAHNPNDILHILGNMFFLWFFGRDVETIYGKQKFFWFYLTTIIVSGLIGSYTQAMIRGGPVSLIGASGGVSGVIIAYICHYPHRVLHVWGVFPLPAWVLGTLYLVMDFVGTFQPDSHVAHTAHLAGAAMGYLFVKTGWTLHNIVPAKLSLGGLRPRPKVRLHEPEEEENSIAEEELDRILAKISREGESSLSRKEKRTLQQASRRYQKKGR